MDDFDKQWVILVDDDEDDRFLAQQAFKLWNSKYVLQALQSGQELFRFLEESLTLPTLILLDLNMPLTSGFEVLERLRAQQQYSSVRIIILTTSDLEADRRQARLLGANNFFTKPPNIEQLAKMITQLEYDWFSIKKDLY